MGDSRDDATPEARDEFAYGPNGRRYYRKSTWDAGNNTTKTEHTFYVGDFEERTLDGHASYASVQKTRVGASIVQVRKVPAMGTADEAIEYLHRDHLGSVEAVTDESGAKLAVLAYDPFGSRRKADWTRALTGPEIETLAEDLKLKISRGYSHHEHLDRTGFVHMNGRLYDPQLGRFLSPDPIVSEPANSQSWNSYSYVANSPLSFTDPTGLSQQPVNMCPPSICPWNAAGAMGGGGFSQVLQAVASVNVNINFGFFVYYVPTFGYGGGFGREIGFGLRPAIGVFLSVDASPIDREVRIEELGPADEPMFTDRDLASIGVGALPVIGSAQSVVEVVTGYDYIADEEVQRGIAAAGIIAGAIPGGKGLHKVAVKSVAPAKRASDQTVLGRYPDYVRVSDQLDARRFEVPPETWERMTPAERWEANRKFLDRTISRGDEIVLSNPASQAKPGTTFYDEIKYLESRGYRVSDDGLHMLPGN